MCQRIFFNLILYYKNIMTSFVTELNKNIIETIANDETIDIQHELDSTDDECANENQPQSLVEIKYKPIEHKQNKIQSSATIPDENKLKNVNNSQSINTDCQHSNAIKIKPKNVNPVKKIKSVKFDVPENKSLASTNDIKSEIKTSNSKDIIKSENNLSNSSDAINPEKILQTVCISGSLVSVLHNKLYVSSPTIQFFFVILCIGIILFLYLRKKSSEFSNKL